MAYTHICHDLPAAARGQRAAVSLHSHTHHSRERLGFLPGWASRVPVLGVLARRELARQERRRGCRLDFMRAYWCPPLPPLGVINSEAQQIAARLQLAPLVSITDHDNIEAAAALAATGRGGQYPTSVEWTVPFRGQVFHLGVHNLPPANAAETVRKFQAFTQTPDEAALADILSTVASCGTVLVVLNHPLWNAHVDEDAEQSVLDAFVRKYRPYLHATEVNGYRSHAENKNVLRFGDAWDLPVVAGGDRHGRAPNALLNVTAAETFDEFVFDVRYRGASRVVVMPEYRDHPATRVLEVISDVLGNHQSLEPGQRRWLQRVFVVGDDGVHRPLEQFWTQVPRWLRAVVSVVSLAGSGTARSAIRLGLPVEHGGVL